MRKIYIAGSISGDPNYKYKFLHRELLLTLEGWEVKNPTNNTGESYKELIDKGLKDLMECDAIFLLRDWKESPGAKVEYEYAKLVGLEIIKETLHGD